ncbi:DUF1254 domain-containing protein [Streptomyces sp. NPDC006285]|uniref:DUF1254 domain-containing protein n=1 Tax=Streptomyces sp. NPDC006285 TaxID=3364742 RepID=UPI00368397BE
MDPLLSRAGGLLDLALQAYVFGYPLVALERTRRLLTSQEIPIGAPVNTFLHVDRLMTPTNREVVKPNNDTLYSSAWLDLREGPLVLDVPEAHGRYYSLMFLDAYTNAFAYVGRRTTGTKPGRYVITGPDHHGELPNLPVLASPTHSVWALGRTLVEGPQDLAAAGALIRQYSLTRLDGAPIASLHSTGPLDSPQNLGKSGIAFFDEMCAALALNPPPAEDQPMLDRIAQCGIVPGAVPSRDVTDPLVHAVLDTVGVSGDALLSLTPGSSGASDGQGMRHKDGWTYHLNTGGYGQSYAVRAIVALQGIGAVHPDEALYVGAREDSEGRLLDGSRCYRLRFEPGQLPPVDAFWSLTAYDHEQYLVDNPIERYSIGDRTSGLSYGPDGSLELYLQHEEPSQGPANWLPVGPGRFELIVRCYQPNPELLDGNYNLPPLLSVEDDPHPR